MRQMLLRWHLMKHYYNELTQRLDAANKWNLQRMMESGMDWRALTEAKSKGIDAKTAPVYQRYMDMISANTGPSSTYNVA